MNQLNKAKKLIDETTKKSTQQKEKIKEKVDEIEQKKTDLKNQQVDYEAKQKEQQDERTKQSSLKTLWEAKKMDLMAQMKEIEPHMIKATEEIKKISDTDISEIVSYASKDNMSTEIKNVVSAIKIVLGIKDWKQLPDSIKKLKNQRVIEPPSAAELRKLEKITKLRDFNVAFMEKKSKAVGNFTSWIQKLEF